MNPKISNNVIVTGGLQGIGRTIVQRFLQQGDSVHIFDCVEKTDSRVQEFMELSSLILSLSKDHPEEVARPSRRTGVIYHQVTITNQAEIQSAIQNISEPIHILINNAGITRDNLVLRMKQKDWDDVLAVNLNGPFFCSQEVLKKMIRQEPISLNRPRGYIINISSIVGLTGNAGQANYAASKAGLIGLTKSLAQEYASRNILVNAIAPGFIQTSMTDKLPESVKDQILQRIALKRFGKPEDIANMIVFLTSGQADYMTGNIFEVTGGMF